MFVALRYNEVDLGKTTRYFDGIANKKKSDKITL